MAWRFGRPASNAVASSPQGGKPAHPGRRRDIRVPRWAVAVVVTTGCEVVVAVLVNLFTSNITVVLGVLVAVAAFCLIGTRLIIRRLDSVDSEEQEARLIEHTRAEASSTRAAVKDGNQSILSRMSATQAFNDQVIMLQPWRRDRAIEIRDSWPDVEQLVQTIVTADDRGAAIRQWTEQPPTWFPQAPAENRQRGQRLR